MTYFYYNIHYYTDPCKIGSPVFEKLRFFKMCSQNAGNAISETQILKISWGACPDPPS